MAAFWCLLCFIGSIVFVGYIEPSHAGLLCTIPIMDHGNFRQMSVAPTFSPKDRTYYFSHKLSAGLQVMSGSQVGLQCDLGYVHPEKNDSIEEISVLICRDGEWLPDPHCAPVMCSPEDLSQLPGTIPDSISHPVAHGHFVEVRCQTGYIPQARAKCIAGRWYGVEHASPCREAGCNISHIANAVIKQQEKDFELPDVNRHDQNTVVPVGTKVHVGCTQPFVLVYTEKQHSKPEAIISCKRGKWMPEVQCMLAGPGDFPQDSFTTAVTDMGSTSTEDSNQQKECLYVAPEFTLLRAMHNDREVQSGEVVPHGGFLIYHCMPLGSSRLRGISNRDRCLNGKWELQAHPQCITPTGDDAMILVRSSDEDGMKVAPGGVLVIRAGLAVTLYCKTVRGLQWAIWNTTSFLAPGPRGFTAKDSLGRPNYFISLNILHAIAGHTGRYVCRSPSGDFQTLFLRVEECPLIQPTDALVVQYGTEEPYRNATFACRHNRPLIGTSAVHCTFGTWSEPIPRCGEAECNVSTLQDLLPLGVLALRQDTTEFVRSRMRIQLMCNSTNYVIFGNDYAECSHEGIWNLGYVECTTGCHPFPFPANSSVIVGNVKSAYRDGEYVTFRCPDGKVLSTGENRAVCHKNIWSAFTVPQCVEEDYYFYADYE